MLQLLKNKFTPSLPQVTSVYPSLPKFIQVAQVYRVYPCLPHFTSDYPILSSRMIGFFSSEDPHHPTPTHTHKVNYCQCGDDLFLSLLQMAATRDDSSSSSPIQMYCSQYLLNLHHLPLPLSLSLLLSLLSDCLASSVYIRIP